MSRSEERRQGVGESRHLTFGEILRSITVAADDYDYGTMRRLEHYKRLPADVYGVASLRPVAKAIAGWDFHGRLT